MMGNDNMVRIFITTIIVSVGLIFPDISNCQIEIPDGGEARVGIPLGNVRLPFISTRLFLYSYKYCPTLYGELGFLHHFTKEGDANNSWDSWIFAGGLRIQLPITFLNDFRLGVGVLSRERNHGRYSIEIAQEVKQYDTFSIETMGGFGNLFSSDRKGKLYISVGLIKPNLLNY